MLSRRSFFGCAIAAPFAAPVAIAQAGTGADPALVQPAEKIVTQEAAPYVMNVSSRADPREVAREIAALWSRNPSLRPSY